MTPGQSDLPCEFRVNKAKLTQLPARRILDHDVTYRRTFIIFGGRTRTRTLDPLIKRHLPHID